MDESSSADYCRDYLPPAIVEKLEAGAFRQLCHHLQERSDEVQNIDLMTLSGFCRNCLAKWMVVEARKLVDNNSGDHNSDDVKQALNALGYDEAAQHVYGMTYVQWKSRHQKKATDEQMKHYKASEPLHAKHDKTLLATRDEKPPVSLVKQGGTEAKEETSPPSGLMSNVCCQDVEEVAAPKNVPNVPTKQDDASRRNIGPYQPPPLPKLNSPVRVAILTVSDRAFKNEYASGDLSGPAVEVSLKQIMLEQQPQLLEVLPTVIVPDDTTAIQQKLKEWAKQDGGVDIILTSGGTGMSPRDITPEATRAVLDTECAGLMGFIATECSRLQPLASLTRGTAGIMNQSLVANLPGNPKGVGEVMPILLPLLLHALQDIRA